MSVVRLLLILTVAAAVISVYGWWFHVAVGPAHGAGQEIGILAGVATLCLFGAVLWRWPKR